MESFSSAGMLALLMISCVLGIPLTSPKPRTPLPTCGAKNQIAPSSVGSVMNRLSKKAKTRTSSKEPQNRLATSSRRMNSTLIAMSIKVRACLRCAGVGKIALASKEAPIWKQTKSLKILDKNKYYIPFSSHPSASPELRPEFQMCLQSYHRAATLAHPV